MNVETGVDLRSDPNCNSVECLTGHSFPFKDDAHKPVFYNNFGPEHLDSDILDTATHLKATEGRLGKWTWQDSRDDGLLNWMPAPNAEAEEKPKKNETKAAPAKEAAKTEAKPAEEAKATEAAAVQVEEELMKKPSKKSVKKPVTKSLKKHSKHNHETRQTDNKNWPKHRFHFKNNYKGFP